MSTWRWPRAERRRLAAALLLVTLQAAGPAQALLPQAAASQLLALRLNGVDRAIEHEVLMLADGGLALPEPAWCELGLVPRTPAFTGPEGRRFHRLDAQLRWTVDGPTQTLAIQAPPAAFTGDTLHLDAPPRAGTAAAPAGAFLNYDLLAQQGSGSPALQGLLEGAAFGEGGTLRHAALLRRREGRTQTLRLDSTLNLETPGAGAALRLGDAVAEPGAWGRALRFGGLQWSTEFALRPELQTMAAPVLRGEASLPSTVDLLVGNGRSVQGQVPAGPFLLTGVPVAAGRGEVRVVVRDLLGREQLSVQPYYASPALLQAGLSAQSVELGVLREDYGLASNHYGRGFASATDRRGLDDGSTRELRAEAADGQAAAGAGWAWPLPRALGLAQLGVAGSRSGGRGGIWAALGAEHQSRNFGASVQLRRASASFARLGQGADGALRLERTLAIGGSWHGLALGLSHLARRDQQGRRAELGSATVSWQLAGAGSLGLFLVSDRVTRQRAVQLVWSVALQERQSLALSVLRDDAESGSPLRSALQWQRSAPEDGGAALRVLSEQGEGPRRRQQADLSWDGPTRQLSAGLTQTAAGTERHAGAAGSLAWVGNSLFAGRRIDDSFAVVEVADYPGVPVLLENKPVAVTDAHGRAFVAGLRGRESNRLSIDPSPLPFDAELADTERQVVPPARSGVVVTMPLVRSRAARFRLVDDAGVALPAGSVLVVDGQTRRFPVGFDGLGYAAGLRERQHAVVRWGSRRCELLLELPTDADPLPDLGTVACR